MLKRAVVLTLLTTAYAAPLKVTLQAGPRLAGSQLTYSSTTTVTARRGREVVWQKKIFSPPYNAKDPTSWGVVGSVVWLTYARRSQFARR